MAVGKVHNYYAAVELSKTADTTENQHRNVAFIEEKTLKRRRRYKRRDRKENK